jgi:cellulose synthase/poly-beta-1,6-N-acetylglucosamine synthase-like glycosyltransferase
MRTLEAHGLPSANRPASQGALRASLLTAAVDIPVVVIVPAHNEAEQLPGTVASLRQQTRIPDEIIVVSDRSTDDTVAVARGLGVTVMTTVDNRARKAGAINQVLSRILTGEAPDFLILVMDADTELSPQWIETAARELAGDPLAAVGGTYLGSQVRSGPDAGAGSRFCQALVRQFQFNEFARASRLQARKHRKSVWCLSGTGTMARASMLREIASERGCRLPGRYGEVYDSRSSTEDFELTLAVRSLGYRCVIPKGCDSRTEVMPTMRAWFKQRLRWQYGTLESLLAYGFNRVTWGWQGWTRQALFHLRFLGQFLLWFVLARALITSGATFPPFILACLAVVYAERLISVWHVGWRGWLLAALIVPEFLYGVSEGAYLTTAIWKIVRREPLTEWGHL